MEDEAPSSTSKLKFDLGFVGLQTFLNNKHQPWAIGGGPQIGLRYPVSSEWDGFLRIGYQKLWDDTTTTSTVKLPSGNNASMVWTMVPIRVGLQRVVAVGRHFSQYVNIGGGLNFWSVKSESGGTYQVFDKNGDSTDFAAVEPMITLGLGLQRRLSESMSLDARVGFSYLLGLTTDFSDSTNDYRSRGVLSFSIGVSGLFGGGAPATDPFMDHVTTPLSSIYADTSEAGESVEGEGGRGTSSGSGFAQTERGTEDDDGDGVDNYHDLCPGTPQGVPVDVRGCPLDADGDGVPDPLDVCPATPEKVLVDERGCPLDTDGDGVFDGIDQCPGTPEVAYASVDDKGCPADADNDGVADFADKCPDTPPGPAVDADGCRDTDGDGVHDGVDMCPETPAGLAVDETGCLVMTQLQRRLLLFISYESGTSDVDILSRRILDDLIIRLKRTPNASALVEGFTDNIGEADANLLLSQKRAEKVREYLIDGGIEPDRVEAVGHGETKFLGDNETASGRSKNRRIEISFSRR